MLAAVLRLLILLIHHAGQHDFRDKCLTPVRKPICHLTAILGKPDRKCQPYWPQHHNTAARGDVHTEHQYPSSCCKIGIIGNDCSDLGQHGFA